MYPDTLPASDNTHRANPGMCDEYTEIDEDGVEYTVPDHLICRALTLTLKDDTLRWVTADEASRLRKILADARYGADITGVENVLTVITRQGYTKIGVIYSSPDEGFEEQHYLMRSENGLYAIVTPVVVDETYLDDINTSITDVESDCLILRLESNDDILLAQQSGLLCQDDKGAHVQVRPWRSVLWQCSDDSGQPDQERLRGFWRRYVENTAQKLI